MVCNWWFWFILEGSGTSVGGSSKREAHMRLATEDQPLIQPSEVLVNVLPVHTAQPIVTPIGNIQHSFKRTIHRKPSRTQHFYTIIILTF